MFVWRLRLSHMTLTACGPECTSPPHPTHLRRNANNYSGCTGASAQVSVTNDGQCHSYSLYGTALGSYKITNISAIIGGVIGGFLFLILLIILLSVLVCPARCFACCPCCCCCLRKSAGGAVLSPPPSHAAAPPTQVYVKQ